MTVVEDRPIMSVKYCLPVPVFYFLAKTITHPAARSLCDSWAFCSHSLLHTTQWYRIRVRVVAILQTSETDMHTSYLYKATYQLHHC